MLEILEIKQVLLGAAYVHFAEELADGITDFGVAVVVVVGQRLACHDGMEPTGAQLDLGGMGRRFLDGFELGCDRYDLAGWDWRSLPFHFGCCFA